MESHNFWSSSRNVDGKTSGRMDKACPSLTKHGPSSVKASLSFTAYLKHERYLSTCSSANFVRLTFSAGQGGPWSSSWWGTPTQPTLQGRDPKPGPHGLLCQWPRQACPSRRRLTGPRRTPVVAQPPHRKGSSHRPQRTTQSWKNGKILIASFEIRNFWWFLLAVRWGLWWRCSIGVADSDGKSRSHACCCSCQ